ncbi:MAG: acyltransferase [Eubacteriales bacterium]|nr:acyltransferase [Eubacteriales bacterium]
MSKSFFHPTAIIDEGCTVGEGTRIWHWCHIMKDVKIGDNCNIGEHAFIESGVVIGNGVKIKNNVAIYTGVVCEDDVFLGPNCVFTNVANPRSYIERKNEFKKTIIKKGATIGANATIVCGNDIEEYAFVGAGSVVTKTVPAYTMVIGNPAKFYAHVCKCGVKLDKGLCCPACGAQYIKDNNGVIREK